MVGKAYSAVMDHVWFFVFARGCEEDHSDFLLFDGVFR